MGFECYVEDFGVYFKGSGELCWGFEQRRSRVRFEYGKYFFMVLWGCIGGGGGERWDKNVNQKVREEVGIKGDLSWIWLWSWKGKDGFQKDLEWLGFDGWLKVGRRRN